MSKTAIELRNVGKRYWKLDEDPMLLRSILPFKRPRRTALWVLRAIDLTIEPGESVGVLGRNGAGKTTLLRLLAGVTQPTEGRVRVVGTVAPLISVGVGFHDEMSGRENVLINGLLLGLERPVIEKRFDKIVEFAELEEFIDTPVKFYSSGMYMRLGFSIAVHTEPDIMLVDEILAVGDAAFQAKCHERLQELQFRGTSIIFVSHSQVAIRRLCQRAVLLHKGGIEFDGESETAIARHHALMSAEREETEGHVVQILESRLLSETGQPHHANHDEAMELAIRMRFLEDVEDPQIALGIFSASGVFVVADATARGDKWRTFAAGEEAEVRIPFRARLAGGTYGVQVAIRDRLGKRVLGRVDDLMLFVAPRPGVGGIADLCTRFLVDGEERSRDDAPVV